MNWRLYIESRKARLLQIVAAVAAMILFFTAVSHFQTKPKDKTTHRSEKYTEEYGCGVHVEVRNLVRIPHISIFNQITAVPCPQRLFISFHLSYSVFAAKM